MLRFAVCCILILGLNPFWSCQSRNGVQESICTVHLSVSSARGLTVFLMNVPYFGEKEVILDSQTIKNAGSDLLFRVPNGEQDRQYKFKISKSFQEFVFIPDSPEIRLNANNANGKLQVTGSAATQSLEFFRQQQQQLMSQANKGPNPSIQRSAGANTAQSVSQNENVDSLANTISERYRHYADTVANAAAFIAAYQHIDFGKDYPGMLSMLERAAQRFPNSKHIYRLRKEAKQMVDIYLFEYEVGDTLPHVTLPDLNGKPFNTAALENQYYFIDFWADWCESCKPYSSAKTKVRNNLQPARLAMVSVALDDDLQGVRNRVQQQGMTWTQLVDTAMWQGSAAATIKFDSIPSNYLVAPGGKIIAKSIPADSLVLVIRRFVR